RHPYGPIHLNAVQIASDSTPIVVRKLSQPCANGLRAGLRPIEEDRQLRPLALGRHVFSELPCTLKRTLIQEAMAGLGPCSERPVLVARASIDLVGAEHDPVVGRQMEQKLHAPTGFTR